MSLGTNLSRLRVQSGMSQDALAEQMGVSRQSVSKWETDASAPELEKLVRLAEIFGVSLDKLVRDIRPEAEEVPEAAPAPPDRGAAAFPLRNIVGVILLCMGGLVFLLLTVLGGALTGLLYAVPFAACGVICLACRRRAGLWCGWAVYAWVNAYLELFSGANTSLVFTSLRYPGLYRERPGQMLFAWLELAALAAITVCTVWAFRRWRLPRNRRTALWLAAGWFVRLAGMPLLMEAAVRWLLPKAMGTPGLAVISLAYHLAEDALLAALAVCTAAALRKR